MSAAETKSKVLIMAGGTGGHVFPALAVADELRSRGVDVVWLGTRRGLESDVVPKANIDISYISVYTYVASRYGKLSLRDFAPIKTGCKMFDNFLVIKSRIFKSYC